MTTCPACAGKRTIETTVPNIKRYNGVEYVSNIQPTKVRIDQCPTCRGTGRVDDLYLIWEATKAKALIDSERAAAD